MAAAGSNCSVIQHHNAIRVLHGGDPLGDDDLRHVRVVPVQGLVELCLGFQIQRAGGIIKDQDLAALQKRAGNGNALALPAGQAHAALGHRGVISRRLLQDKGVRLCGFGCGFDFLLRGAGLPDGDVVADRGGEELALLQAYGDLLPQRGRIVGADVRPVHQHTPLCYVVKAGNQVHQRGFSAAGGTDDSQRLPGCDLQRDAAQHRLLALSVSKADVFKRDGASRTGKACVKRGIAHNVGLRIQNFTQPPCGGQTSGQRLEDHGQHHHTVENLGEIGDSCHNSAGSGITLLNLDRADVNDADDGDVQDNVHYRAQEGQEHLNVELSVHQMAVCLVEALFLTLFLDKCFDHTDTGDVLLNDAVEPVQTLLQDGEQWVGAPYHKDNVNENQRKGAGHNHTEAQIQREQKTQIKT